MQTFKGVLFRRSPHLVCYWDGKQFVFENYASGTRLGADPLICKILDDFDDWRPPAALFDRLKQFSPASLLQAIRELAKHCLLQRSDRPLNPAEEAMQTWRAWNPAAGFFHFSTKDVLYDPDPLRESRHLRRKAKKCPMPAPVKHYPKAPQTPLPPYRTQGEFPRTLLARRTWRRFSARPLQLSELATLLGLTWGVQRWMELPGLGRAALKTSPAGGARHCIEAYVLALRVEGLPRGLYHYAADTHCLELLARGATSRQLQSYVPAQWWYSSAAALTLMTAVFPRHQWRYDFARGYRAVLLEAGHVCQTFCLVATWLGLAPFCTLPFASRKQSPCYKPSEVFISENLAFNF